MARVARQKPLLGTFVEISAEGTDRAGTLAAITAAFGVIEHIHQSLSFQNGDSDLTRLNRARGAWVDLPSDALRLLRLARAMGRASGGLFNATVGGQMVALGVLPDHGFGAYLPVGSADDTEIDGSRARLRRGVLVTLDGIAKGYAVDRAVRVLKRHGVASGIVNAGGDLRVFGDIAEPVSRRELDGSLTPVGLLKAGALATSMRHQVPDDRFPGHIVGAGGSGVFTVMAAQAWRADALTKVASLAAAPEAMIARLGGHLLVPASREAAA